MIPAVKHTRIAFVILLAAAGGLAATGGAQQPASTPPPQAQAAPQASPPATQVTEPIRVPVNLVNVIATVVTRREKLVNDLEKSEFHVKEDGKEQRIEFFARETDLPLRIALLLDTSNSIRERLEFEKDAAIEFLHNTLRRRKDQAFLMIFDNEPVV